MNARTKLGVGALLLVAVFAALVFGDGTTAAILLLVGTFWFLLWKSSESADADTDADTPEVRGSCADCGEPIPTYEQRCDPCSTVGDWRK